MLKEFDSESHMVNGVKCDEYGKPIQSRAEPGSNESRAESGSNENPQPTGPAPVLSPSDHKVRD